MTKNQYEHYMVYVEHSVKDNQQSMDITATAVDLNPEKPVTMRNLEAGEVTEDMDGYVDRARLSMNTVCDRLIDQVLEAAKQGPIIYHGYVDLVDQLQQAPNLLLANMLGALLSSCAEEMIKNPPEPAQASK